MFCFCSTQIVLTTQMAFVLKLKILTFIMSNRFLSGVSVHIVQTWPFGRKRI